MASQGYQRFGEGSNHKTLINVWTWIQISLNKIPDRLKKTKELYSDRKYLEIFDLWLSVIVDALVLTRAIWLPIFFALLGGLVLFGSTVAMPAFFTYLVSLFILKKLGEMPNYLGFASLTAGISAPNIYLAIREWWKTKKAIEASEEATFEEIMDSSVAEIRTIGDVIKQKKIKSNIYYFYDKNEKQFVYADFRGEQKKIYKSAKLEDGKVYYCKVVTGTQQHPDYNGYMFIDVRNLNNVKIYSVPSVSVPFPSSSQRPANLANKERLLSLEEGSLGDEETGPKDPNEELYFSRTADDKDEKLKKQENPFDDLGSYATNQRVAEETLLDDDNEKKNLEKAKKLACRQAVVNLARVQIPLQLMFWFGIAGCIACTVGVFFPPAGFVAHLCVLLTALFFTGAAASACCLPYPKDKLASGLAALCNLMVLISMGCLVVNAALAFTPLASFAALVGTFAFIPAILVFLAAPALSLGYVIGNYKTSPVSSLGVLGLTAGYCAFLGFLGAYAVSHAAVISTALSVVGVSTAITSAALPFLAPILIGIAILGIVSILGLAAYCIYKGTHARKNLAGETKPIVVGKLNSEVNLSSTTNSLLSEPVLQNTNASARKNEAEQHQSFSKFCSIFCSMFPFKPKREEIQLTNPTGTGLFCVRSR